MAVTKAKEQEQVETPVTHDLLTSHQPQLSDEVRAKLQVPIPADKQLTVDKGKKKGEFQYADEDYLKSRLSEVDPDWQLAYRVNGSGTAVECTITILGVPRMALAGVDEPSVLKDDNYQVVRVGGKAVLAAPGERGYNDPHLRYSKAQSASFRRACAEHELGAHMWPSKLATAHVEGTSDNSGNQAQSRNTTSNNGSGSQGGKRAPSDKQISLLTGQFEVPAAIANAINAWSRGKTPEGYPISDASEVINALMAERKKDKEGYGRRVWEQVISQHAPYALKALSSTAAGANDDDDDWDAA